MPFLILDIVSKVKYYIIKNDTDYCIKIILVLERRISHEKEIFNRL